jgi:dCTP deaminase
MARRLALLATLWLAALATPVLAGERERLLDAAHAQVGVTRYYDSSYVRLAYPGGDVAPDRGVCTDVVVRSLRATGLDLQQAVHEDIRAHFSAYPPLWGLRRPDRNIDHRRVPNLETWMRRAGHALSASAPASRTSAWSRTAGPATAPAGFWWFTTSAPARRSRTCCWPGPRSGTSACSAKRRPRPARIACFLSSAPFVQEPRMSIKSDKWIRRMAEQQGMIEPFEPGQVKHDPAGQRIVSYGTSSYGYDVRCAREFKIFTNINSTIVDPKNFDPSSFVDVTSDVCIIPPNSFALARTVEFFRIPRDTLVVCLGKSTYARCGIIVNVTPLEPEWEGHVTLEFSNTTPLPAKIYAGEGVAQMLFFQSDEVCETSYKDRGGKYQGQTGVTLPRT